MKKPTILVCNDDGILAPGIIALATAMKEIGEVVIVAPDSPQSGMGHAISITKPLRLEKCTYKDEFWGWQCSGTPADCVKLARQVILKREPDILVSGINHGSNASVNVIYSGTMSAAMEGALFHIPSIGFSLCDYGYDADFTASMKIAQTIVQQTLEKGMPKGTLLNVNIPKGTLAEIKGIKITRQAEARWTDEINDRIDPYNRPYYWLMGTFEVLDHGEDTDLYALEHNYVSVCPVRYDFTAHHVKQELAQWNLELR